MNSKLHNKLRVWKWQGYPKPPNTTKDAIKWIKETIYNQEKHLINALRDKELKLTEQDIRQCFTIIREDIFRLERIYNVGGEIIVNPFV